MVVFSPTPQQSSAIVKQIPEREHKWKWYILIAFGLAVLVLWGTSTRWHSTSRAAFIPEQITFDSGWTSGPSVSRDGSILIYVSDRGRSGYLNIWVREGETQPRQLTDGPASDTNADISPDGKNVVFQSWRSHEGIWSIPTKGGVAKLLARAAYSPRFSPDGKWIVFSGTDPEGIFMIPADGGTPRKLDSGVTEIACPVWYPDGSKIVFNARDGKTGEYDLWAANGNGSALHRSRPLGIQRRLLAQNLPPILTRRSCPQDWIGNSLLFATHRNEESFLFQVSFKSGEASGQIEPIPWASTADSEAVRVIPGRDSIVFETQHRQTNIWATTPDGSVPLRKLTNDSSLVPGFAGTWPALSGDGNVLVFITNRGHEPDICLRDLRNGTERTLNARPSPQSPILLDRTGKLAMFVREQHSAASVILRTIGQKTDRVITSACPVLHDWFENSSQLLCSKGKDLFLFDINQSREIPLAQIDEAPIQARFSPDGNWISFSVETGQSDTTDGLILRREDASTKIHICREGYGLSLHWAPSNDGLYYWSMRDGFRCLYLQRLNARTKMPLGNPVAVLHRHSAQRYPWRGGTLAVASNVLALTLQDELANIWTTHLPR